MRRFSFALVLFTALCASSFAQADLQVLAIVKLTGSRASITVKQLKGRVDLYEKQMQKDMSVDDRKKVLQAIIDEKLVIQAAEKAGITVPESAVDQYFLQSMSQQIGKNISEQELNNLIKQQFNMSLDEYLKQQFGMGLAEYKERLKITLTAQQYVMSQRQQELQGVAPTDDEIRTYYGANEDKFVQNDMVKMLIVNVPKGDKPDAAKAKVNEIMNGYKSKKMTRDQIVSKSKSDDSYDAVEAYVNKNETSAQQLGVSLKELTQIFTRDIGYTSDVFDNAANYQFYAILEKFSKKFLELSDVVSPGTTVTVYEYIKQGLTQQKQAMYLQKALEEISKSLDTAANVERKKTGADLDKLLAWEGKYSVKTER